MRRYHLAHGFANSSRPGSEDSWWQRLTGGERVDEEAAYDAGLFAALLLPLAGFGANTAAAAGNAVAEARARQQWQAEREDE